MSAKAGVGEAFPKLSVAMDGDSQASHGRAARSVFWKGLPDICRQTPKKDNQSDRKTSHSANSSQL
jgi:hypothetical protein